MNFAIALLVASLCYFSWPPANTTNFKSLIVYLENEPAVQQPWELFFHSKVGYSALNKVETIGVGKKITFPIKTNYDFSKLRLDPGNRKIIIELGIERLDITQNGVVINSFSGQQLFDLIQPLNNIEQFDFDESSRITYIRTNRSWDPQLELKLDKEDFMVNASNSLTQLITSLLVGLFSFTSLFFGRSISDHLRRFFVSHLQPPSRTRFLYIPFAFLLFFGLLYSRANFIPLKLLVVALGEQMDVPQDNWTIYFNVDGYQETYTKGGVSYGNKVFFPINSKLNFSKVRIDPGQSKQTFAIKNIELKTGIESIKKLEQQALFDKLIPLNGILNTGYDGHTNHVIVETEMGDPFWELDIAVTDFQDNTVLFEVILSLLLSILSYLIVINYAQINQQLPLKKTLINSLLGLNLLGFVYTLSTLGDPYYGLLLLNLVWLCVLPGAYLKNRGSIRLDSFVADSLLAFGIGAGIILLPLNVSYAFNIPNGNYVSIVIALILSSLFLIQQKQRFLVKNWQSIELKTALEITFLNVVFWIFISPIANLLCPPLHDPAVIAVMADQLQEHHFVKEAISAKMWNYPPYLQLFIGFLGDLSKLSTPKTILLLTNLVMICSGFAFGYFWNSYFRNKYAFYISALLFLFIAPFVSSLYFTAGKNAMIFGFFYWFLLFILLQQLFSSKSTDHFFRGFVFILLVISAFQFHYTTIFIIPIFLTFFLVEMVKILRHQSSISIKGFLKMATSIIGLGVVFGVFSILQYQESIKSEKIDLFYAKTTEFAEQKQKAKVQNTVALTLQKVEGSTPKKNVITIKENPKTNPANNTKEKQPTATKITPEKSTSKLKEEKRKRAIFFPNISFLYRSYQELLIEKSGDYSLFKYPIVSKLVPIILLLMFFFTKRKKEIGLVLLLAITLIIFNNSNIYNLVHYTKVIFFLVPLFTACFMLNYLADQLKNQKILVSLLLGILSCIAIQQAINLSHNYYQYRNYSVLTDADLKAFEYIDKHLVGKGFFAPLNVANINEFDAAQGDASLYLHLTNMESVFSYVPSKQLKVPTPVSIYMTKLMNYWRRGLKNSEFNLLNLLKRQQVKYIYSGAFVPWGRPIPLERLLNSPNFSLIYDEEGVQIFEINKELVLNPALTRKDEKTK